MRITPKATEIRLLSHLLRSHHVQWQTSRRNVGQRINMLRGVDSYSVHLVQWRPADATWVSLLRGVDSPADGSSAFNLVPSPA
ncbi:hypothetical protein SESBI_00711 [Sesbania bispinosa]|nr:hypothetical protein SESBI_00711 [Sesbania bispinosa]